MSAQVNITPTFPRRAFLAATASALCAGAMVALASLGGLSNVETQAFQFSRGVTLAAGEEERLVGLLAQALPDDRMQIIVVGHTGNLGDASANLALSEDRAALVATRAEALGISAGRISARGIGGAAPLPQQDGESDRAHQSRMARVDVTLQMRR